MSAQLDIREEELPESLAEIARAIGLPATLKLVERFGGVRVYVPQAKNITKDHPIALAIGLAPARSLAKLWPMENLPVPSANRAFSMARHRSIWQEPRGVPAAKLALKYRLSEREIYRIRSLPAEGSGGKR